MIDVSTSFNEAFKGTQREELLFRVTINGVAYDKTRIFNSECDYGIATDEGLFLGTTFSNSLKVVFSEVITAFSELDEVIAEMGIRLPDGSVEYCPLGTFVISERVDVNRNDKTTSIFCLDNMALMEGTYESSLTYPAPIRDVALEIANKAGMTVNTTNFSRLSTNTIKKIEGATYRQAIGMIAQLEAGYALFNRQGELEIRTLNNTEFEITPDHYRSKGLVKNDLQYRLGGISVEVNDESSLQIGSAQGSQISLENSVMTQLLLDNIYTKIENINFYPFTLEWWGNPALEVGDWVLITDLEGNEFKAPVLSYKLKFDGGISSTISADVETTSNHVTTYKPPLKQKLEKLGQSIVNNRGEITYFGLDPPAAAKEGDRWMKPEGPDEVLYIFTDGDWVRIVGTGDVDVVKDQIDEAIAEIEGVKTDIDDRLLLVNQEIANNFTSLSTSISNATDLVNTANANAQTALNSAQSAINQLGGLSGKLTDVQNDIDDINGVLLQKVSTADFNSLTGRVNVAEGQIQTQANQIALRVTETQAQTIANDTVGALEIGGRNYFSLSHLQGITPSSWITDAYIYNFNLEPNTKYILSSNVPTNGNTSETVLYFNGGVTPYNGVWLNNPKIMETDSEGKFYIAIPTGRTYTTRILNGVYWVKLEKGSKATDWTPAPEDTTNLISNLSAELTVESGKITQLLTRTSNNETAITQVKATADGTKTTVANHAGRLTTVETNVSGLQVSVADKVSNAQFTVLSNSVNSVVTDVANKDILQMGANAKQFTNVLGVGIRATPVTGALIIKTPIGNPYMCRVKIAGYNYVGRQDNIDLIVSFYSYVNGFFQTSFTSTGTYKVTKVRLARSPDGNVAIIIDDASSIWSYPHVTVTEAIVGFNQPPNAYKDGWSLDFSTDTNLSGYTYVTELSVGMDVQSSITQQAEQINLRVTKGDVMSQINIEAGRTLISSNKLYLDANTVTFSGSAFIPSAAISSLSADKVTTGTLNAANVNIINLNVSSIVGLNSSFVQSAWNGITSDVNIDSTGVVSRNTGNTFYTRLRSGNIEFGDDLSTVVGSVGSMIRSGSDTIRGLGIFVRHNKEFGVAKQWTSGGNYEYIMRSAINSKGLDIYTPTSIRDTLNLHGNQIHNVNRIYFGDTTQGIARGTDASQIFVADNGIRLGVGTIGSYTTKLHINDTSTFYNNVDMTSYVTIRNTLNMSGQAIHDVGRLLIAGTTSGLAKMSSTSDMAIVGNRGVWLGIGSVTGTWSNTLYVGNTVVRLHGAGLDMNGGSITNQSDARLKHNIHDTDESALAYLRQTRFVNYEWIDETKPRGIHLGVIAQDTPWLIFDRNADVLSIDNSKQVMYNSLGIKELVSITDKHTSDILRIDTFVGQHEQEINNLKQEIASLKQEVEYLKSA